MATLTLKNVPDDLYRRLKESAALHRRSINAEAILCLERNLGGGRPDTTELVSRFRRLRRRAPNLFVTEEDLARAKEWGRK